MVHHPHHRDQRDHHPRTLLNDMGYTSLVLAGVITNPTFYGHPGGRRDRLGDAMYARDWVHTRTPVQANQAITGMSFWAYVYAPTWPRWRGGIRGLRDAKLFVDSYPGYWRYTITAFTLEPRRTLRILHYLDRVSPHMLHSVLMAMVATRPALIAHQATRPHRTSAR